jgi:F-box protein 21
MTFLLARPEAADAARFIDGVASVIKDQFPLDTEPILDQLLPVVFEKSGHRVILMHLRNAVARLRDDIPDLKARVQENVPRWWVGMVFRHARLGYVGVVIGWDEECAAGDEWILEARVYELSRGREQPFYTVLAADGSSRCE